ncbi:basic 7S globulin [Prunus yedoensis var. nudiflora]|uniref:Basic 7S globulin n=1 Tax=Prunus yedoensis var. nudiflora TaxID=2094558 RepID=A0A314YD40_PRUYE|nr:basic 7S globulin [Prunus yedoensis var. nudiflora]
MCPSHLFTPHCSSSLSAGPLATWQTLLQRIPCPVPRVAAVEPFGACFNSTHIRKTRVGPVVPNVDFVLQSESVYWRVLATNSMVQVSKDVLCLGFVDAGLRPSNPRTAIVIGGHQLEENFLQFDLAASRLGFSSLLSSGQTTCANFNFTSNA